MYEIVYDIQTSTKSIQYREAANPQIVKSQSNTVLLVESSEDEPQSFTNGMVAPRRWHRRWRRIYCARKRAKARAVAEQYEQYEQYAMFGTATHTLKVLLSNHNMRFKFVSCII